jgi:putative addiction module killer protein
MIEIRQSRSFLNWRAGLKDKIAQKRIAARIDRLAFGLMGDVKPVGGGVSELRLDFGPGYRLYFLQQSSLLIILLCGGDKASQQLDIKLAQQMAREWKDGQNDI